jgi:hypothetical protein
MLKARTRILCLGVGALLLGTAAVAGSNRSLKENGGEVAKAPTAARTAQPAPVVATRKLAVKPTAPVVAGKVESLQTNLRAAERRHMAIARQIKSLEAARAELKGRMDRYRKGTIARLTAQLREAEALHNIFKARLAQSGEALERQQRLKTKGYASQANFDAASASSIIAQNDVAASAARIERIRVELDAAKKGVFIGDGRDDVPYSQQRDDEIMLRLVDLNAAAQSAQMAINDIAQQIALAGGRPVSVAGGVRTTTGIASVAWDTERQSAKPQKTPADDTYLNQPD